MIDNRGFTLIEVIITMTLIAIAAAMFVAYMGTSLTQSPVSSGMVAKQYKLIQQMELITSAYRQEIEKPTPNLGSFKTAHIDGKPYVDAANTGFKKLVSESGGYQTQDVLVVILKDGDQTIMSIFTQ